MNGQVFGQGHAKGLYPQASKQERERRGFARVAKLPDGDWDARTAHGGTSAVASGFSRAEFDLLTWQQARGKWGIRQVTEDVGAIAEGKGVICVFLCVICVFCVICVYFMLLGFMSQGMASCT